VKSVDLGYPERRGQLDSGIRSADDGALIQSAIGRFE
jgi:hypothetical protein